MNKDLYEKYANYYIDKFKDSPRLIISKKWVTEDILHIAIYTKLPSFEFFMGIFPNMILFDGICVCDQGIDFDDIEKVNKNEIFAFLDNEANIILNYIENGLFLFAYQNADKVVSMSTNVTDRKKLFENFDIEKFYNEQTTSKEPDFEVLTKIELLDFYGDVVYEYSRDN
jgi:hypothetical protein